MRPKSVTTIAAAVPVVSQLSLPMGHGLSRVGQVGPVDSCRQVEDLAPSLVKSRNLSWVGQVRNIDPSGSK